MTVEPFYQDDYVTLYHGDCLELADLWAHADVMVTDPPYGIGYVSGGARINASGIRSTTEQVAVANDADTAQRDAVLALWGGRPAVVFGTWKAPRPKDTVDRLIWFKRNTNPALGTNTPWSSADEEIYILGGGLRRHPRAERYRHRRSASRVWRACRQNRSPDTQAGESDG